MWIHSSLIVGKHLNNTEIIIRESFENFNFCKVATAREADVEFKIHFPTIIQGKNFLPIAKINKSRFMIKFMFKCTNDFSKITLITKNRIYRKADFL